MAALEIPIPLFTFERGGWYINVWDYKTSRAAFEYWNEAGMTAQLYGALSAITTAKRRGRAE